MRKSPPRDTAINLIIEAHSIRENERIVITNALEERTNWVEPRNYPALFIDASMEIDRLRYSVCYAVQRRVVKPNHLFLPISHVAIKEKATTAEWFYSTGAQLIAYYNYQTESVWLMRTQALRELDEVIGKNIKQYIPHANNLVFGYLISYADIEATSPLLIEVTNEKHQLGIALAQSIYF